MLPWFFALALALEQAVPLPMMAAHAERIVVAEVTSSEVRWAPGPRGELETVVWLATESVLRGDAPATLEIVLEGGQMGEHRTWVSNQPDLREDRRYVLLLVHDTEGRTRVIGESGAIEVRSERSPEAPPVEAVKAALEVSDVD